MKMQHHFPVFLLVHLAILQLLPWFMTRLGGLVGNPLARLNAFHPNALKRRRHDVLRAVGAVGVLTALFWRRRGFGAHGFFQGTGKTTKT